MTLIYSTKYTEALLLASDAHKGQTYNGEPYINHPMRVSDILIRQGYTDEKYLIVAFLHDVVEDTPTTLAEINSRFGDEIVEAVNAITRHKGVDYKELEPEYLARVCANRIARIVKFADMLDNLTMTGHVDCPEHKQKLWRKYVNAIGILKRYEEQ